MNKLVAVTLEGKYHVFDLRTFNKKKGFASLIEKVSIVYYSLHDQCIMLRVYRHMLLLSGA